MTNPMSDLAPGLAWAGAIVAVALGASLAQRLGHIDQDTTLRLVIGLNGLMIAYFGNRAPKAVAPSVFAGRMARFAGWSMVLSGLLYAALWAFAPIDTAIALGTAAVAASVIATMGYAFKLRADLRNR